MGGPGPVWPVLGAGPAIGTAVQIHNIGELSPPATSSLGLGCTVKDNERTQAQDEPSATLYFKYNYCILRMTSDDEFDTVS